MFLTAEFLSFDVSSLMTYASIETGITILCIVSSLAALITLIHWICFKTGQSAMRYQLLPLVIAQLITSASLVLMTVSNGSTLWNSSITSSTILFGLHSTKIYATTLMATMLIASHYTNHVALRFRYLFQLCGIIIPGISVFVYQVIENNNINDCEKSSTSGMTTTNSVAPYISLLITVVTMSIIAFHLLNIYNQNRNSSCDIGNKSPFLENTNNETQPLINGQIETPIEILETQSTNGSISSIASSSTLSCSSSSLISRDYDCTETCKNSFLYTGYGSGYNAIPNETDRFYTNEETVTPQQYSEQRYDSSYLRDYSTTTVDKQCVYGSSIEDEISSLLRNSDDQNGKDYKYFFLTVLLSGGIDIVLYSWNIFSDDISGIYIMLYFLHSFLSYGQGIMSLLFFVDIRNAKDYLLSAIRRKRNATIQSEYLEI